MRLISTRQAAALAGQFPFFFFAALALLVLSMLVARTAGAHMIGQSYLYIQVYEESITGRYEIALVNLNPALGLEGTDREITPDNYLEHVPFLQDYYREKVTLSADGKPLTVHFTETGFLGTKGNYVTMAFDISGYDRVPERLDVDYNVLFDEDPEHQGFLLVETNWATGTFANESGISLVFSPGARQDSINLTSKNRWRGFVTVLQAGIEQIWRGYDHIVFLLALLLPAVMRREDGKWKPIARFGPALLEVVKIVMAFVVGHSITLSLGALGIIELPWRLVEVIIAVSIGIAAANILYPIFRGRALLVVLGFGLLHGFAFAGALAKMDVFGEHLLLPLLAFNLGIEIGLVVIVAVVFPVLYLASRFLLYPKLIMPLGAALMITVSLLLVVERTMDFSWRKIAGSIVQELRS